MTNKPQKKAFDCIEMKRKIQEKMADETQGMEHPELLQYYKQRVANSRFAGIIDAKKKEQDNRRK